MRTCTRRTAGALAALALLLGGTARADLITFANVPSGTFGPGVTTTEGNFAYDVLAGSGTLFGNTSAAGNPPPHVEGGDNGGTLQIVRAIPGGLFTFEGLDVAQALSTTSQTVRVIGLLGGVQQGEDDFATSATSDSWLTVDSVNLSGVQIDELRVRLDGSLSPFQFEEADNVRLTPASVTASPEPASLTLLGLGVGGIACYRWRRRR
jgi:hypothetical protein